MNTITQKERRKRRTRLRARANEERARLSVFRSNRHLSVQIIDDRAHTTLVALDDRALGSKKMTERAKELGILIAKKALEKNIARVVFDRGGYTYHGAVRALAEGAREGGLDV